jgi:quercetin dioxygenase-like cupin family protein
MSRIVLRTMRVMVTTVMIMGSVFVQHVIRAQPSGIKRVDLQRHDLSAPGREAVQVRVDFAPGAAFPKHSHPGEEIIYVLEGSLEYQIENQPPIALKQGDVLFVPAGTIHAAKNVGSGIASELATYVVEKGKPLLTLAE